MVNLIIDKLKIYPFLLMAIFMLYGCASASSAEKVSDNGQSISSQAAQISSDSLTVSSLSQDETSENKAEEEKKETEEIIAEEMGIEEGNGDEIVAVDEENDINSEEEALQIKDVRDDNSELPFETDTPIFAFDTDYTLYDSASGTVRSGAIDAINYLVEKGFKWCIISVDYENSKEGRLQGEILSQISNTDSYLGFYIVNSGAERYQWCIENGADILVDDNEKTASLADQACFHTLLVDADDDIPASLYLHPMGHGSSYGGFEEYVNMLFGL